MPDSKLIEIEGADGVETWLMNAAPVNALSPELLDAFDGALDRLQRNKDTSVVVLTSGLRVFSAGADASWMAKVVAEDGVDGLLEQFNVTMDRFRSVCIRIRQSPVLFVAAINGHALAGGLELAVACDLRFATDGEKVQFGVPEMSLFGAMPSGGGGVQYLARLMGSSTALKFVLDAEPVGPEVALGLGLVDWLLPAESVLSDTVDWARGVASKAGPVGVAAAKRSIIGGAELPFYEAMEFDRALHWDAMRRGNFTEGVAAFVEKFGGSAT